LIDFFHRTGLALKVQDYWARPYLSDQTNIIPFVFKYFYSKRANFVCPYFPSRLLRTSAELLPAFTLFTLLSFAQIFPNRNAPVSAGPATAQTTAPPKPVRRADAPAKDEILVTAIQQVVEGSKRFLIGRASLETTEFLLKADEIIYDEQTGDAEAKGQVEYKNFETGETLHASRIEYNLKEESGKFYEVMGSSPVKVTPRPGLLLTTNPFLFQGRWAEKIKNRYLLHDGFLTNCKLPKPAWRLTSPKFDIIPGDRALAYKSFFKVGNIPILYAPVFYKSLEEQPRKSGFLTPNAGTSSRRGFMYGLGYYWAINRSYDAMYRSQYFTQRGFAHEVNFRGKPKQGADFNFYLYGVNDRGRLADDGQRYKEGGYLFNATGIYPLGRGWETNVNINYLSSFLFRQAFTQSFNEAIFSEVNSTAYVTKHWSTFTFHGVFARHQLFQSSLENDQIVIRKLPSFEFLSRDRQISTRVLPLWVSLESSAGFLRRRQPLFETRSFMERFDVAPRVTTAFHFKGFHILPSMTFHSTTYGSSRDRETFQVKGDNLVRTAADFHVDLVTPTLEKIFQAPRWLGGGRIKHVIEPRAHIRKVTGIGNFLDIIRFDEIDMLANTTEGEVSLTNRFYTKKGAEAWEVLTWQVRQRRYFDPTFGGALVEGQRNVFASSLSLTGYSFFDRPRSYSPIVSSLRFRPLSPAMIEWRTDYDPFWQRITNSTVTADVRVKEKYAFAIGHNQVRGAPAVSPNANQLLGRIGMGTEGGRGWNAGFSAVYDYRINTLQFATTEVSYNSDCCGLSIQYRRFSFGTRNENQFLVSFSVANIGSFGTLRKQEKLF
jgi:LPS-assembly protein